MKISELLNAEITGEKLSLIFEYFTPEQRELLESLHNDYSVESLHMMLKSFNENDLINLCGMNKQTAIKITVLLSNGPFIKQLYDKINKPEINVIQILDEIEIELAGNNFTNEEKLLILENVDKIEFVKIEEFVAWYNKNMYTNVTQLIINKFCSI